MPDSEVDTSDIPEDHRFWGTARMKPNRFAGQREKQELKVVVLDKDVAEAFTAAQQVEIQSREFNL